MGEVYRAPGACLDRDVAIKVLPGSRPRTRMRLRRFEQEAKAAGALNHPNILAVFDIGDARGRALPRLELLEGETLRERLRRGRAPRAEGRRLRARRSPAAWPRPTRRASSTAT